MHFWVDGFYNRNVPFVIIMDMSGHRITTKHPTFPPAPPSRCFLQFLGEYRPLIGRYRSRDLNAGLWLVGAQYRVSVCLCLLALVSDWLGTNQLKLLLVKATADWTTRPVIGPNSSRDPDSGRSLVRVITYFQSELETSQSSHHNYNCIHPRVLRLKSWQTSFYF